MEKKMTKQGNDQLFVENIFKIGILDIRQNSKYDWGSLKAHGNAFFTYERDLPNTFVTSGGNSGRPNVPQWKKDEMKGLNSKIRSTSMCKIQGDQSTFGCWTYVERLSIAS